MMDTTELIPYFRDQLIQSGQSPLSLDRSLQKARIESAKVTEEIEHHNLEQVRLLQKYFAAEEARTKQIEHLLEKMQTPDILLTENALPVASFVSEEADLVSAPLARYTSLLSIASQIDDISTSNDASMSSLRSSRSFQNRL